MKFNWKNAVILAVICAVIGCAVALTYSVAGPRIVQKAEETANEARQALFPEADSFEAQELAPDSGLDNCYAALRGGEVIGYTAQVTVSGSQGMIEVISGLNTDSEIVGITVGGSGFSETPGLGAKTKEPDFTSQFAGLTLPAVLKENVDGVTGATISSAAVVSAVNLIGDYIQSLMG